MSLKRTLINVMPDAVNRMIAVPYDFIQVKKANREFRNKDIEDISTSADAPIHISCIVVDALRGDVINQEDTPFLDSLD